MKFLTKNISVLLILFTIFIIGLFYITPNITMTAMAIVVLPITFVALLFFFKKPIYSLWFLLVFGLLFGALSKMTTIPLGTLIDGFLIIILSAVLVQKHIEWSILRNSIMLIICIWCLVVVLELFNPHAPTYIAWVFAMRAISYQIILIVIISAVLIDKYTFESILKIWLLISLFGALDGIRQKMLYPNLFSHELQWLREGGYKQHVLFGQLRAFSFYTDAGQYGASMGHALTSSIILMIHTNVKKYKLFYAIVAGLTFIGLLVSGTRGALFVPVFGIFSYFIISKNWKILTTGILSAAVVYYILAFTSVGSGIYEIRRMRTAINPVEDPSFQVRLENQRKLGIYLKDKPFGTGVGTSASFGSKFSPTFYASTIPEDSLYVRIWVETGIVGLTIYILMLLWIIIKGGYLIWNMPNDKYKSHLMAVWAGFIGVAVASYGNMVLTQIPTSIICYITIGYIIRIEYDLNKSKTLKHISHD